MAVWRKYFLSNFNHYEVLRAFENKKIRINVVSVVSVIFGLGVL